MNMANGTCPLSESLTPTTAQSTTSGWSNTASSRAEVDSLSRYIIRARLHYLIRRNHVLPVPGYVNDIVLPGQDLNVAVLVPHASVHRVVVALVANCINTQTFLI